MQPTFDVSQRYKEVSEKPKETWTFCFFFLFFSATIVEV